jgi:hypothetical protein
MNRTESYIPHPHWGVRYNKARGSLLTSATPPPQSVRHWTPALHVGIPIATHQQIKKKNKRVMGVDMITYAYIIIKCIKNI